MQTFVYQPTTGDRVFARSEENPELCIVTWANGCRHICGDTVELSWGTACPNKHWRNEAHRLLIALSKVLRLVAWDEQGNVFVAVVRRHAWQVNRAMNTLGGIRLLETDKEKNELSLIVAGVAFFMSDTLEVSQHNIYAEPIQVAMRCDLPKYKEEVPSSIEGGVIIPDNVRVELEKDGVTVYCRDCGEKLGESVYPEPNMNNGLGMETFLKFIEAAAARGRDDCTCRAAAAE